MPLTKSLSHVSRLLATGVAATALSCAGAVAVAPDAAVAASATASFTCNFGARGTAPVTVTIPNLPTSSLAGVPIPAQTITGTLTLTRAQATGLAGVGKTTITASTSDFKVAAGPGDPLTVSLSSPATATTTEPVKLTLSGTFGSLNPKAPVMIPVVAPTSFDLSVQNGTTTYPCTSPAATTFGTIDVRQQHSKIKGKVVGKVHAGKSTKVAVSVTQEVGTASGKVLATIGKKQVGKAHVSRTGDGTVTLLLDPLDPGTYKVKLTYKGNMSTASSSKKVKITVPSGKGQH